MYDKGVINEIKASRAGQLARIEESGLIRQGRVFALSLTAIQAELGARWAMKSDQVWETVERALTKNMPPPDVFVRLDETTVLAAIASTDAYEGQVRCAEVLRSILTFFLGRAAEADIAISRVSNVSGGELSSEPIDLMAPPVREQKAEAESPVPTPPERWVPPLAGRQMPAVLESERNGRVPFAFEVVPVWRLDQSIISAYAIRRRLPAPLECFTDADREQMGARLLDHLIPLLEEYREHGAVFALIIEGTFSTTSARRPRTELLRRCAPVLETMRKVVVMELGGFGVGVPSGRIAETAAMIRPFFRLLTACVRDAAEAEATVRDYAFSGIAIDAQRISDQRLDVLVKSARRRTHNVIVHGVREGVDEDRLRALGVSHVTYRSQEAAPSTACVRPGALALA